MRLTRDRFESLVKPITVGNVHPPLTAVAAFASLLASDELVDVIGESFVADERTVWVLAGVTFANLIHVRASSACENWSFERSGTTTEHEGEQLEADLWPLSAVRSLRVTRVRNMTWPGDNSGYELEPDWAITLRDGSVLSFPSSAAVQRPDHEHVARFIAAIRSHL